MPRKAKQSNKPLKQQTLNSFLNSSPKNATPSPPKAKSLKAKTGSHHARKLHAASPQPLDSNEESEGDSSDVAAIKFEPDVIELSDEDASPRRPSTQRRGIPLTQAGVVVLDDDDEDSIFFSRNGGSDSKLRKNVKLGKRKQVEESSSESEEKEVQPRRRKLIKGTRPPSIESDDEDLMEEVEEHRKHLLHMLLTHYKYLVRYITNAHARSRQKDHIPEESGKIEEFV